MERPSRMAGEPGEHLRMLMAAIIVEDRVDRLAGRDCRATVAMKRMNSRGDGAARSGRRPCLPGRRARRTRSSCRGGCHRAGGLRISPAPGADPAGFGRAPGSGLSRRWTARPRGRAGAYRDRRRIIELRGEVRIVGSLEGPDPMRLELMVRPRSAGSFGAKDPSPEPRRGRSSG